MRLLTHELILSLVGIVVITPWYICASLDGPPRPSSGTGFGLGITGFLLMLSSEILYTLRKHLRRFTFGEMRFWLRLHIVTGIIGPYLVLLHSAGKFNGLAGVLSLVTVMIVVSGFVGRFIYTAVPRTLEGAMLSVHELEQRIAATNRQLQSLGIHLDATPVATLAIESPSTSWFAALVRNRLCRSFQRRLRIALNDAAGIDSPQAVQIEDLLTRRYRLLAQVHLLALTRRLLARWHMFHVPLGAVLFTLAFIHIGAALFYGISVR